MIKSNYGLASISMRMGREKRIELVHADKNFGKRSAKITFPSGDPKHSVEFTTDHVASDEVSGRPLGTNP